MSHTDEHTLAILRGLKSHEGAIADNLDENTARELLKTPPTSALRGGGDLNKNGKSPAGRPVSPAAESGTQLPRDGRKDEATADIVKRLQDDCDAFEVALKDNVRLAREQMHRSLLQLFEDTIRGRLAEVLSTAMNRAAVGGTRTASRRPVDRGLDQRDHQSDFVIPDSIRDQISNDIRVVVDHEMKRCFGAVGTDTTRILAQVLQVRERMSKLEEDMMQQEVETKMQAEQLQVSGSLISSLQERVSGLQSHNADKESQMDLLRCQIERRNQHLDETRVKFRKEVMRYKARQYDLEMELESHGVRKKPPASDPQRRGSVDGAGGDDDGEFSAATESALKELSEKFSEDLRQAKLQHEREMRKVVGDMNMKLRELDAELHRLKTRAPRDERGASISSLA